MYCCQFHILQAKVDIGIIALNRRYREFPCSEKGKKNPVHAAAQSMMWSGLAGELSQTTRRHSKSVGVIGRRGLGGVPALAWTCLIPVRIYSRRGIALFLNGSPNPKLIDLGGGPILS